jgi:P63C domain
MEILNSSHQGDLNLAGVKVSCAVLSDKTRVLVERSLANALGQRGSGAYWKIRKKEGAPILPEYLVSSVLNPYISLEIKEKIEAPIKYINKKGREAFGINANLLPEICDIWIKAKNDGVLNERQQLIAEKAYTILKGFAKIGIIALIDEATGYQGVREKDALQKILDQYLNDYTRKWSKTFPDKFWDKLLKIRGYNSYSRLKRPSFVGRWVNDLVYDRLAPGITQKLQTLNPKDERGNRKSKHHQYLTDDRGVPELREHLTKLMAFMDAAANNDQFERMVARALPKCGEQLKLELSLARDMTE